MKHGGRDRDLNIELVEDKSNMPGGASAIKSQTETQWKFVNVLSNCYDIG